MRSVNLYPEVPHLPVVGVPALAFDDACRRCKLGQRDKLRTRCMPADGEPGGLLVVSDYPGQTEDNIGRPFVGPTGDYLRGLLAKMHSGPLAMDNAIRCAPGNVEVTATSIATCRGYLRKVLEAVRPTKILAMGSVAVRALTGRSPSVLSVRKGYTWHVDGDRTVPVYLMPNPVVALRNRFLRDWFEEDLRWALTTEPPFGPPWKGARGFEVANAADADEAASVLWKHARFAFDVETAGRIWNGAFQLLCVACCSVESNSDVYIWGPAGLSDDKARAVLVNLLSSKVARKVGSNVKFDQGAVRRALGVQVSPASGDARLLRKLLETEADGDLETMAELVGMGRHKEEAEEALKAAAKRVASVVKANAAGMEPQGDLFGERVGTLSAELVRHIKPGDAARAWAYGFLPEDVLLRYCSRDALATARLYYLLEGRLADDEPGIGRVYRDIVMPAADAVRHIERWGVPVDKGAVEQFRDYLRTLKEGVRQRLSRYADLDPDSNMSVATLLFKVLKLPPQKETKTGKASTDAESLKALEGKHPVVADILEWRRLSKLDGTYATGILPHICPDGRIHPNLLLDGARSGRMSCVASWTPIETKEGKKLMVRVRVGDQVCTHRGRWRRVTAFISQGVQTAFDVWLSNGDILTCTKDHRLLLLDGRWVKVVELLNEYIKDLGKQCPESAGGFRGVPKAGHTLDRNYSKELRHDVSQCAACNTILHAGGRKKGAGTTAVSCVKVGFAQSNEGQNRRTAPQLERAVRGRARLSDLCLERQARVCPSSCDNGNAGVTTTARGGGCSSYRRGHQKQLVGQPSAGYVARASSYPLLAGEGQSVVAIEKIVRHGRIKVYDISVAEDESYSTCGVFSHNCSEPNMQNIPRDADSVEGKMIRRCFAAAPGNVMVNVDYSQLEYRIAAMLSGDEAMIGVFERGEDVHLGTAKLICKMVWGIKPEDLQKSHRTWAKTTNFALLYGMGDPALAARLGCSLGMARQVREAVLGRYPKLRRWIEERVRETARTGYARTWWAGEKARRRSLYRVADHDGDDRATAEHSSYNSPVQGTGSDFLLASMSAVVDWIIGDGVPAVVCVPIHDALLMEVREDAVDEVVVRTKAIMCGWDSKGVPIVVDAEVGPSWGDLQKV